MIYAIRTQLRCISDRKCKRTIVDMCNKGRQMDKYYTAVIPKTRHWISDKVDTTKVLNSIIFWSSPFAGCCYAIIGSQTMSHNFSQSFIKRWFSYTAGDIISASPLLPPVLSFSPFCMSASAIRYCPEHLKLQVVRPTTKMSIRKRHLPLNPTVSYTAIPIDTVAMGTFSLIVIGNLPHDNSHFEAYSWLHSLGKFVTPDHLVIIGTQDLVVTSFHKAIAKLFSAVSIDDIVKSLSCEWVN